MSSADSPNHAQKPDLRLPAQTRLRSTAEFQRLLDQGRRVSDGTMTLWAIANGLEYSRFGLVVGRKHGEAVARNRVRRRLREAFRLSRMLMPAGFDFAAAPHAGRKPSVEQFRNSLLQLATRLAKQSGGNVKQTPM